jgi:hypothetical protein
MWIIFTYAFFLNVNHFCSNRNYFVLPYKAARVKLEVAAFFLLYFMKKGKDFFPKRYFRNKCTLTVKKTTATHVRKPAGAKISTFFSREGSIPSLAPFLPSKLWLQNVTLPFFCWLQLEEDRRRVVVKKPKLFVTNTLPQILGTSFSCDCLWKKTFFKNSAHFV